MARRKSWFQKALSIARKSTPTRMRIPRMSKGRRSIGGRTR